jgi:hypothetical protein
MEHVSNKGVRKGVCPWKKKKLKNERYHIDRDEERNPMGEVSNKGSNKTTILFFFLTHVELYSILNNTRVTKCSNS